MWHGEDGAGLSNTTRSGFRPARTQRHRYRRPERCDVATSLAAARRRSARGLVYRAGRPCSPRSRKSLQCRRQNAAKRGDKSGGRLSGGGDTAWRVSGVTARSGTLLSGSQAQHGSGPQSASGGVSQTLSQDVFLRLCLRVSGVHDVPGASQCPCPMVGSWTDLQHLYIFVTICSAWEFLPHGELTFAAVSGGRWCLCLRHSNSGLSEHKGRAWIFPRLPTGDLAGVSAELSENCRVANMSFA